MNQYIKNYIDIIFLIILAFNILLGLYRGLIKEIFKILALAGSIIVTYFFSAELSTICYQKFNLPSLIITKIVIGTALFLCTSLIINFIGYLIQKLFKIAQLGSINRIVGGFFGLLKGFVFIMLILLVFNLFNVTKKYTKDSYFQKLYTYIEPYIISKSDENSKQILVKNTNQNNKINKIFNSDKIKEFLKNNNIHEVINDTQIKTLLNNKKFVELLSSKEFQHLANKINFNNE